MKRAGIVMTHVPYTGSGPALMDLIAGRADLFITTVPVVASQVQEGALKLLAVTGEDHSPLFPDAPTLAEQGVPGGGLYTLWGIVGRPGMRPILVAQLNQAVNDAAASPAMVKRFADEVGDELSRNQRGVRENSGERTRDVAAHRRGRQSLHQLIRCARICACGKESPQARSPAPARSCVEERARARHRGGVDRSPRPRRRRAGRQMSNRPKPAEHVERDRIGADPHQPRRRERATHSISR